MPLLGYNRTKELLDKYEISFAQTLVADSPGKAKSFAEEVEYPVILKIYSPEIVHRTEKKAVQTNIQNETELEQSYSFLENNFEGKILIQPQLEGQELIIGIKQDPSFEAVLMVGLGGIFTEIFQDTSIRINPIDQNEAKKMLKELKSYPLLTGFRGRETVNLDNLINLITKVSELGEKEENIQEIDLNPVIVNSKEALVVDPKIFI